MFDQLAVAPPDPILGLNEAFKQDPNPHKINLSVGVYLDDQGRTPILACVQQAAQRLVKSEANKGYLGIDGLAEYVGHVQRLVFGDAVPAARLATAQTPGGTGGLRVAGDFLHKAFPGARVWCSRPTWANHPSIFQAAGMAVEVYPYLDSAGRGLDLEGMLAGLRSAKPGDVVCLHACCHNPTGVDPTVEEWRQIAGVLREGNLLPLVDFAYQGFGDGLREDTVGVQQLLEAGLELVVCSSFSKNFGLYGERVGALTAVAGTPQAATAALSQIKAAIRANYSNPPKHGAALVATILGDAELRQQWEQEVASMRERIHAMRQLFVKTLAAKGVQQDFSFLCEQRGMFSYSGLNPMQVDQLRSQHAIYIVGNGRINVAGMTTATMDRLCTAIAQVLATS